MTAVDTPPDATTGAATTRIVTGVCHHDCPDSCGWTVTVEDRPAASAVDGSGRGDPGESGTGVTGTGVSETDADGPARVIESVAVKLRGTADHPYSQGELCPKVNRYLDRVYSPERVLTPLRRTGAKGSGEFEPISWDDALAEIGERWNALAAEHGPEALAYYQSAGNQSQLSMTFPRRFLHAFGTSRTIGSVCGAVAGAGVGLTYGSGQTDNPLELRHAKVVLLWGTNTRLTNRHLWPFVEEARSNGAQIVVIDPIRTMTAESADTFIQPLPGTDVALMLAVMHILVRDDHIDHEYVTAHASGYDELAAHVADWTPQRAADITGLSVDTIEELAALYATSRHQGVFLRTLIGAEHSVDGATFFRTAAMLPVLTGAWKQRGGGFARSVGVYSETPIERPIPADLPAGSARRSLEAVHLGHTLAGTTFDGEPLDPPVQSLLVFGGNPLVTLPNSELLRRGLERQDLFTVVHEQFITDTARYADIVLPATTQIEQTDVMPSWGSPHITWNHQAIPPRGEAVSNVELFRRLATAVGLDHPELHRTDEELLDELFDEHGSPVTGLDVPPPTRADVEHSVAYTFPVPPQRYAAGGFATADGKALLASDGAAQLGLGRVPDWRPLDEATGAAAETAQRFPFIAYTIKANTRFLNSSYAHLPNHGGRERPPAIEVCADDAIALGIEDGDLVRIGNDRGSLELPVRISDRVRPGLVTVPFGWHEAGLDGQGSANSLTNDTPTAFGGGVAYHDTRVVIAPVT